MHLGDQCLIGAVGVDEHGQKHVLGLQEGATENSAAAKDLLEDLVRQGINPARRRLFVIDRSKALRAAINAVFGGASLVQGAARTSCGMWPNGCRKISRSRPNR
jgi:putative transposase